MKLSTIAKLFRKSINNPKRRRDIRTFTQGLTNSELLEDRVLLSTTDGNDQLTEAQSLGGMNVARSWSGVAVDFATDVDMYSFSVRAGQRIGFDIDRPSGSLDSYIRIFNGSGTQLAFNDDGAAPGEAFSFESYVEHAFTTDGTYYVGVSGFGNSGYSPTLGNGDRNGSTGAYRLNLTPIDTNDSLSESYNLGALSTTRTATGFRIDDRADVDMFRFTVTAGQRIEFDIDRPSGSLDSFIRLFNSSGTQLASNDDGPTPGESSSLESYLAYTFTTGGTYYLGVSSYGNQSYSATGGGADNYGVSTGAFTLRATPLSSTPPASRNVLYLNFEGSNITNSQLRSWAGTDWAGSITSYLDEEGNGITVNRFLNGRADRDAVISGIMSRLQTDLSPYGITVQRVTGMGATGVGATTLFFGNNNMATVGHVACDIDYSNNNRTDIAFIEDEDWGTTTRTATALADVALHEAGHTFGLFHVNTVQSGVIYNETMGLRYSTAQTEWVRDTAFMDRTFTEYLNHGGGRGSQNAHRVMRTNFGITSLSAPTAEPRLSSDTLRAIFVSDACMGHDHDDDDHDDHDDDHAHDGQFFNVAGLLNANVNSFANVARMTSLEDRLVV